mmetsp:Transcript_40207/g.106457  ORF Transcript_40207/g.106457 Transcript_40207/m.106457 type:complete len:215 (-) Transcript_40207:1072-1716(-)
MLPFHSGPTDTSICRMLGPQSSRLGAHPKVASKATLRRAAQRLPHSSRRRSAPGAAYTSISLDLAKRRQRRSGPTVLMRRIDACTLRPRRAAAPRGRREEPARRARRRPSASPPAAKPTPRPDQATPAQTRSPPPAPAQPSPRRTPSWALAGLDRRNSPAAARRLQRHWPRRLPEGHRRCSALPRRAGGAAPRSPAADGSVYHALLTWHAPRRI